MTDQEIIAQAIKEREALIQRCQLEIEQLKAHSNTLELAQSIIAAQRFKSGKGPTGKHSGLQSIVLGSINRLRGPVKTGDIRRDIGKETISTAQLSNSLSKLLAKGEITRQKDGKRWKWQSNDHKTQA
jgi:hypothetical protein